MFWVICPDLIAFNSIWCFLTILRGRMGAGRAGRAVKTGKAGRAGRAGRETPPLPLPFGKGEGMLPTGRTGIFWDFLGFSGSETPPLPLPFGKGEGMLSTGRDGIFGKKNEKRCLSFCIALSLH